MSAAIQAERLAINLAAKFKLSDDQAETVWTLCEVDADRRKRYSDLFAAAQVSDEIAALSRAKLLEDLATVPGEVKQAGHAPATQAQAPLTTAARTTRKRSQPASQPAPAIAAPQSAINGYSVAPFTTAQPYTGGALPRGCKVTRDYGKTWEDYAPAIAAPATSQAIAAPATTAAVERDTRVNLNDKAIPDSPDGKGKLPWILGATLGNDGTVYFTVGHWGGPRSRHMRASVRALEYMEALKRATEQLQHAQELLRSVTGQ